MNNRTIALYEEGRRLQEARRYAEALACFDRAQEGLSGPDLANLLNDRGTLLSDMGRLDEAIASYDRAIAIQPASPGALYNRGIALHALGREAEAVMSYDRALVFNSGMIQAWNNRGTALHALARYAEAVESFDRVLALQPGIAQSWNNRGISLSQMQRQEEALESYSRAINLDPNFAAAWDNRGLLLGAMGRPEEALADHDRALTINPGMAEAWYNRGNILREQRQLGGALQSYERALALKPGNPHAWTNRGVVLRDLKRVPEALESYTKALEINPDYVETLAARGIISWVEMQDYDAAVRDLERAVALDPDCPYALGNLLLVKQYGGNWRDFAGNLARIDAGVRAGKPVTEPFVYQAVCCSPADLQACSVIHARDRYPAAAAMAAPRRRVSGAERIRVGYVSGEFRQQATAFLMAGVYEHHDKSRFEITAFDNGGSDHSPIRARLEAAFDKFVDIASLSDRDAAQKIAGDGIDILVNLNGYFGDHRMGVFAHRPAPIQVNYLGFPATLGAPYMDYIIADHIVIPDEERRFYTEQVVWLPDSYQANDFRRAIAEAIPSRAACGLPAEGLVFCNFNAGYKLTPALFASWMRILAQVPASVLWLLQGDPHFSQNLKQAADAAGVDSTRLVFAPALALAPHLARLAQADLFLDGWPYNAHTTASDALWAGVPLVTRRGTAFPGRVAASLLHAAGLPELVTATPEDYEKLAIALARDPVRLQSVRRRLADNRLTAPLFDTARFTRHIETAYETMMAQSAPESFAVPAI